MNRNLVRANDQWAGVNGGRLTFSSGTPVPLTDLTGQTTIYWTPYISGMISLPTSATGPWRPYIPGEKSVAVPSTLFKLFDVFGYLSSGTLALETLDWTQISASISSFDGTSEFTTSAAHGMAVGDLVGIASVQGTSGTDATVGVNGRVWCIATTTTTSKFTLQGSNISGKTYTASTGTIYRIPTARATALTTLNGVQVKSGDATRVYLGTGMTGGGGTGTSSPTSGQSAFTSTTSTDATCFRLLWNHFNRTMLTSVVQTSGTYTYGTATLRYAAGIPDLQTCIVLGLADQSVQTVGSGGQMYITPSAGGSTNYGRVSCGLATFALSGALSETANIDLIRGSATLPRTGTLGLNWLPMLETIQGSTTMSITAGRTMVFHMG